MSEFAPRPAPERESPDWRRLEVAAHRFGDRIAEGLSRAAEHDTDVDDGTARMIAHVLGRAFGRESALADYGRTGTGYLHRTPRRVPRAVPQHKCRVGEQPCRYIRQLPHPAKL